MPNTQGSTHGTLQVQGWFVLRSEERVLGEYRREGNEAKHRPEPPVQGTPSCWLSLLAVWSEGKQGSWQLRPCPWSGAGKAPWLQRG